MTLARPDPEQYLSNAEQSASIEEVAGDDTAKVYHVSGIYKPLVYDDWNISGEHGDYHAEWLGRELAERLAIDRFRGDADFHGEVEAVVHNNTAALSMYDKPEEQRYEETFFEVAVVPA